MADYYPLLSRAVKSLPTSTRETRRAIYDRASKALLGQLRIVDPPVPAEDIEREEQALNAAIERIEAELAPPDPIAAATAAIESALKQLSLEESETPAPAMSPAGPSHLAAPLAPPRPVAPSAPAMPSRSMPSPAMPSPPRPITAPTPRPTMPMGQASRPASVSDDSANNPDTPVRPAGVTVTPAPPRRPGAAGPRTAGDVSTKKPLLLYGGVAAFLALAGGIGFYAWQTRITPDQFRQNRTAAGSPAAATTGATINAPKLESRAGGSAPADTRTDPAPAATRPVQTSQAEPSRPANQSAQGEPAAQPGIPVAQRSAILISAPNRENAENVETYVGTAVWRTETLSRGPGQPPSLAVRAELDIPSAKFSAIMTIEKNMDPTLPASHTVTWRFQRAEDSPVPAIAETDTLQMRDETSPSVDPMVGARARITANIFIIALASGDLAMKRNLDLLQNKGWFDLPLMTTDKRAAKITLEKGVPGSNILSEAMARWAQ